MLLVKKGYPEEDEFVFCTVTNIQYHCVFAKLDEYDNKSGMIHISEIASGRIRNIREYVKEGKKVVCKVLRISEEKGHIDLSLRRVNEAQRRGKINDIKQELAAEKIIEFVAAKKKLKPIILFNKVYPSVHAEYTHLYECFEDVASDGVSLQKLGIDTELATELETVIKQRIRPPEIHLGGELHLTSYDPKGVDLIKQTLEKAKADGISIKYSAAGRYLIDAQGEEPKSTEKLLNKTVAAVEQFAKKKNVFMNFVRKGE